MTVGERPRWVTLVALDDRPQAVRAGVIRGALVEHQAGAEQQRAGDGPRSHHPAEVGEPEQGVARAQVELVREVLGTLDGKAAMHVDRGLRPPGRARRVDQQIGRLGVGRGVGWQWRSVRRRGLLVPPGVAIGVPRRGDGIARTADDEDPANGRRERRGLVRDGLERHPRTSSQESVGRDEHARVAVGEPRGHGRGGVAREDRGVDRTDPAEREDRDHGFRQQREQDPDPVASADPVCAETAHGCIDLGQELAVGQPADRAILALPDERLAVRVAGRPGFGGRTRIVERAAAPPARPGRPATRVEHLARSPLPRDPDVVRGRAPEPARVGDRSGLERVERRLAGGTQEPRKARIVEQLGRRPPRGIGGVPAEDRPGRVAGHAGSLASAAPASCRRRRHIQASSGAIGLFRRRHRRCGPRAHCFRADRRWGRPNRLGRGGSPEICRWSRQPIVLLGCRRGIVRRQGTWRIR